MVTRAEILEAVGNQTSLPSIPELVLRLESELRSDEPSIADVVAIIEQDPALSLRVLSVANSAFYTRGKGVSSVRQAMMRLGLDEIRRLTVAAAVVERFKDCCGSDPALFWGHSLAVAFATRAIAAFSETRLSEETVETAFTCGLLHDLGTMAFGQLFSAEYRALLEHAPLEDSDTSELERDAFGIDHGEVGAALMTRWEVPEVICQAVAYHHRPWALASDHVASTHLVQLVHIADFVCSNQGFGRRRQLLPARFDDTSWDALGLSLARVPDIIASIKTEGERSEVFMGAFA